RFFDFDAGAGEGVGRGDEVGGGALARGDGDDGRIVLQEEDDAGGAHEGGAILHGLFTPARDGLEPLALQLEGIAVTHQAQIDDGGHLDTHRRFAHAQFYLRHRAGAAQRARRRAYSWWTRASKQARITRWNSEGILRNSRISRSAMAHAAGIGYP